VFLLSACCLRTNQDYPHTPLHLDKIALLDANLTDYEADQVINAMKAWECSTNGMVRFTVKRRYTAEDYANIGDPFAAIIIKNTTEIDPKIVEMNKHMPRGATTVGLRTLDDAGIDEILIVEEDIYESELYPLMEHELAHVLHISHASEGSHSIMNPDVREGSRHLVDADVKAFCDVWGCNAAQLRACP